MIRARPGLSTFRLTCMSLTTSLTVLWLFGCSQGVEATHVQDEGHGVEASKNTLEFVKANLPKKIAKGKMQIK
jgi:hypothetical protein